MLYICQHGKLNSRKIFVFMPDNHEKIFYHTPSEKEKAHKLFPIQPQTIVHTPAEKTIPRRNRRFRSGQHFNYFTISTSFGAFILLMIFPFTRLCSINITPKGVGYAPLTSFIPSGNAGVIFIFLQPADNTFTPSRYFVTKPTTPDDQPWHRL